MNTTVSPRVLDGAFDALLKASWLPPAVNTLALLIFVASAAQWTWAIFSPIAPSAVEPEPLSTSAAPAQFNAAKIQAADLFGASPLGAGGINNIPISSLDLVLTGIIEAGSRSIALIKANGHDQSPFAVGQDVVPGVTVAAVLGDRVLIRHQGHVESLLLKQPVSPLATPGRTSESTLPLPPVHEITPGHYQVPPALFKQELTHPQPLLQQALVVPYEAGGFLIRSIEPGSLYQKLGLRVGDVIRSVNGQPMNSLQQAMQAYRHLGGAGQIDLQILRNGQVRDLHYRIQ